MDKFQTELLAQFKEHKIRIKKANDIVHERSFSSFTITSHGKEEND